MDDQDQKASTPQEEEQIPELSAEDTELLKRMESMSDVELEKLSEPEGKPQEPSIPSDYEKIEKLLKREMGQIHNRMGNLEREIRQQPAMPYVPPTAYYDNADPDARQAQLAAEIERIRREQIRIAGIEEQRRGQETQERSWKALIAQHYEDAGLSPKGIDWGDAGKPIQERHRDVMTGLFKKIKEGQVSVDEVDKKAAEKAKEIIARRKALQSAEVMSTGGSSMERLSSLEKISQGLKEKEKQRR